MHGSTPVSSIVGQKRSQMFKQTDSEGRQETRLRYDEECAGQSLQEQDLRLFGSVLGMLPLDSTIENNNSLERINAHQFREQDMGAFSFSPKRWKLKAPIVPLEQRQEETIDSISLVKKIANIEISNINSASGIFSSESQFAINPIFLSTKELRTETCCSCRQASKRRNFLTSGVVNVCIYTQKRRDEDMNARAERLYETKRLTECSIKKHLEFTSGLFNDRLKKSKFSLGGMQKPCRVKELKQETKNLHLSGAENQCNVRKTPLFLKQKIANNLELEAKPKHYQLTAKYRLGSDECKRSSTLFDTFDYANANRIDNEQAHYTKTSSEANI